MTQSERYRVLRGLTYPGTKGKQKRAEPGDVVKDLPAESVPWLLEQGHVEPVEPVDEGGQ